MRRTFYIFFAATCIICSFAYTQSEQDTTSLRDYSSLSKEEKALKNIAEETNQYRKTLNSCIKCKLCNCIKRSKTKHVKDRIAFTNNLIQIIENTNIGSEEKLGQIYQLFVQAQPFRKDGGKFFCMEMNRIYQSLGRTK